MSAAREAGHTDAEIQRLVLANFGDPGQIARNFAWVYRHERRLLQILVFVLSTVILATLLTAAVFGMQAGAAIGFGIPVPKVLVRWHMLIEALDILATVVAYVGLLSVETLFDRQQGWKAVALLALTFAMAFAACTAVNVHPYLLVFGFVTAFSWELFRLLSIPGYCGPHL